MMPVRRIIAPAVAALTLASHAARADDDLLAILNESIVTTASQAAETESTAPAISTTISSDDLRRYGIRTIEEAVNFLSLGVSSAGGRSLFSTVDLGARGVLLAGDSGNHFLVLLDGHAVNEPFFGTARFDRTAGIPFEAVDRIEVIVGPGSVLYGSNAMLGVINIITKDAAAMEGAHVAGETEITAWRRAAAMGGTSFRLFDSHAEVTAAVQYWDEIGPNFRLGPQDVGIDPITERPGRTSRGGPEDGIWGGTTSRSTFARVPSAMLRLRVGDFEVGLRGRIADWGRPFGTGDFDDPSSGIIERSASADLIHRALLTPNLRLVTRLYADVFDQQDRVRTSREAACPYLDTETCEYRKLVASQWAGLETQLHYDWLRDGTLNTLVGFDGRMRFVGSKMDVLNVDADVPVDRSRGVVDYSDQAFGAYAQQTWVPSSWLGFNAGARLDRDPRFPAVLSPRAASSLGLWSGGTLRAIYSEAFRAPTFEETHFSSAVLARGDDLEPERVRSVEGSIEHRFGAHRVLFGAFRSWWRNLVGLQFLTFEEAQAAVERGQLDFAVPNASQGQYRNVATIDSYGFNAALEGAFFSQRLRYGVNITEAHSRRTDLESGSRPLPAAPHYYGNARLAYDLGGSLPTLAVAGYTLSPRPADRAFDTGFRPVPFAPRQLGLRATATGRVPLVKGLSYRLSADSVLGRHGPYVIGPVLEGTPEQPGAELVPLDPFRISIGLQYGLPEP